MIVKKVLILIYHTFYASSHGGKGEQAPWSDFIGVLIPKHFQRTLPVSTPVLETVFQYSGGIINIQTNNFHCLWHLHPYLTNQENTLLGLETELSG